MTKKVLSQLFVVALVFGFSLDADAQIWKKKKKETPKKAAPKPKPKPKKGAIQPYSKVVTKDHTTDEGLFKVHTKDNSYLFELPDSLLNREMLMVTRIAKTASGIGFGGGKTNEQVLRWEKKNKQILLRVVSYNVVADTLLPVHEAVVNSNLEPILFSFPIKAFSKDSTATVIDATSLFSTDVKPLGFPAFYRKRYQATRMDKTRSYIDRVSSYPKNIEIRHIKTYFANKAPSNSSLGSITLEMSNSMVLLPKQSMVIRSFMTSTIDGQPQQSMVLGPDGQTNQPGQPANQASQASQAAVSQPSHADQADQPYSSPAQPAPGPASRNSH